MDKSKTWETLRRLVGTWEGTGKGEFPTISAFNFREVLEVREAQTDAFFHYHQRTWRQQDDREIGSHRETGFISLDNEGAVQFLNAQGSDRTEVLRGRASLEDDVLLLDLKSVVLALDERMISSWRKIQVDGDVLAYTMGMATRQVPDGTTHLTARLTRS